MTASVKQKILGIHHVLTALSILLTCVASIYIIRMASLHPEYVWSAVLTGVGVILSIVTVMQKGKKLYDYLLILTAVAFGAGFTMFALGSVLNVSDYIAQVNFWGDASQFPAIMLNGSLYLAGTLCSIANCYFK